MRANVEPNRPDSARLQDAEECGHAAPDGVLYLVGTPLGNLGDWSPRAQSVLASVDLIACEDTRVTGRLLAHVGLKRPLLSYHAHNFRSREEPLLARLRRGEQIALVSDAGMPCISDPGYELVEACVREGLTVRVVPGPSALTTALAGAGLPTRRFVFEGFLPVQGALRRACLESLAVETRSVVFYEAPHRLLRTLEALEALGLGERRLSVCRELTKTYEEFLYLQVAQAVAYFRETPPRGEFVLVLEGLSAYRKRTAVRLSQRGSDGDEVAQHDTDIAKSWPDAATELVLRGLREGKKTRELSAELAAAMGRGKKEAYAFVQKIKETCRDED